MSIFIEDGYTKRKTIEAAEGIHPELTVAFRPALAAKRSEYGMVAAGGSAAKVIDYENDLIAKHVESYDAGDTGGRFTKADANKLIPTLRQRLLNLILGYEPADEADAAGNSHSG